MRILVLNWRCPRNPRAGGAELVTFEVAKRLVRQGNYVEWFSSSYPDAKTEEMIDGIRVVRAGRQWTVHWKAVLRYRAKIGVDFDVVIDEVNTVPFFTPLWAKIPSVMFIHQIAGEVWWYESRFPINALGRVLEPAYLRLYRRTPIITVSNSTKLDLERLGLQGPITVAPLGFVLRHVPLLPKASSPTFLYVGRLAPSKRLADMITALAAFRRQMGVGELWFVGRGSSDYQASLLALAERLSVSDSVRFFGHASEDDKFRLMSEAHVLLMTSVREGWGLVVSEANACGTPAIAYDVPGLRDSVQSGVTGLIVRPSPASLAEAMVRLIDNPDLYQRLAAEAKTWSRTLSFDKTVEQVAHALKRSAS